MEHPKTAGSTLPNLPAPPIISVRDLHKTYGTVQALTGLSFDVQAGTIFGLLGPNGAGKSTAIRILTALSQPTSGTAIMAGNDVTTNPLAARTSLGLVAQQSGVDPDATGRENLWLQGRLHRVAKSLLRERSTELLQRFDLAEAADRPQRSWSGGMARRLDLAMALIHQPRILILDEPTTGLDPDVRQRVWTDIENLVRTEGLTVLLTTHYLDEADRLADDIAIMNEGSIVRAGTPLDLKQELADQGYENPTLDDVFLHATGRHIVLDHRPTISDTTAKQKGQETP